MSGPFVELSSPSRIIIYFFLSCFFFGAMISFFSFPFHFLFSEIIIKKNCLIQIYGCGGLNFFEEIIFFFFGSEMNGKT